MTEQPTHRSGLRSALISTAGHCAIACGFCFRADRAHGFLDLSIYTRALSRLKEIGVTGVCLTGGEPTHHPEFRQLVRLAHQFGTPVSVVTSAREEDEVQRLEETAHLLANVTVSADSVGAMRLGRTRRSALSAVRTLRRIEPTPAILHLIYWDLTDAECLEIAEAVGKTAATLQLSPLALDATAQRRAGLTTGAYVERHQLDADTLGRHFDLGTAFREHLDNLGDLGSRAEGHACRSSTLYVSATGELRRCPYGHGGINVTAPRADIARFLAAPPLDRVTADCAALCRPTA